MGRISETKSHEQKFPKAEWRCYRRFGDICLGDGDLMIGLDQVDFRKDGTTHHAVIEGLHVGETCRVW